MACSLTITNTDLIIPPPQLPPSTAGDRQKDIIAFDSSQAGVKGLVDSGIYDLPKLFIHPPETRAKPGDVDEDLKPPVIDIGSCRRRQDIVDEVRSAAENWGFFYAVNHGITMELQQQALEAIKAFHEQDTNEKKKLFSRDVRVRVRCNSNYGLYYSKAGNWKDTFYIEFEDGLSADDIPLICRKETWKYNEEIIRVGEKLAEILSEGLCLPSDYITKSDVMHDQHLLAHYYPPCPSPELTMGATRHGDVSFITVLLQDGIGGLQFLHKERWVKADPIPGALVVNMGDLIQMMSNGKYTSAEHRVVASRRGPRVSLAIFFTPKGEEEHLGPFKDLLSPENPPLYREISTKDFRKGYNVKYKGLRLPDLYKINPN